MIVVGNGATPAHFLKARFVIFRYQKYVKKEHIEMTKKICLEPLKSVLGRSISHYWSFLKEGHKRSNKFLKNLLSLALSKFGKIKQLSVTIGNMSVQERHIF